MKQITRHILAISHHHFHSSFRHFRAMKQIQVEAITTMQTIKPSTPTPHHLRQHNLSFFDRLEPPTYVNMILYFMSNPSLKQPRTQVSNVLKTSLADILSVYYPLAGRIADNNLHVNCHDQGALYREANVKGSLTNETISELDPSELSKFLPYDHTDVISDVGLRPLVVVQVNFFECGGLVVGLLMYHKVGDAQSMFTFLKNWASVARKNVDDDDHKSVYNFILPDFGTAKVFPSVDLTGVKPLKEEDKVLRRFVFPNDMILSLCNKYKKNENMEKRPTRVEALTAFIWKRYIASTQVVQHQKSYKVAMAVNLRTRLDPPLPPSTFGSVADMTVAIDKNPNKDDHSNLVQSIESSISSLCDPENTKLYKNGAQLVPMIKEAFEWMNSENEVWILFSSLCRIAPVRDVDFGWGAPLDMHMYVPKIYGKNLVVFMETNDENGIQVWTSFNKEDTIKFEADPEMLAYAC